MDNQKILFLLDSIEDQLALGRPLSEIARRLRKGATDEEIEVALAQFKATREKQSHSSTATLLDQPDFETWYGGPTDDPSSHWSLLKEVLQNKSSRPWSSDMISNLDQASTSVVSLLAPPKSKSQKVVKGLVLGYVQSGKTANFSAVISKAVDSGYKLIVVLAGMHNILRKQTQARLHEELVRPKESACFTLTDVDENGDFQKKQTIKANRLLGPQGGFTLVVLKKNTAVLRNFNSWLDDASEETIERCPTLIIDDEADQATINTNKPENDPTAINNHIRNLIQKFYVVSYVGYTATPFANVLIDAALTEDVYPKDFLVSLDKPLGYVGTEELFGRDAIEPLGKLEGLPVIRSIPNDDVSSVQKKRSANADKSAILPSMLTALDSFILAGSARLARGQWKQHMTMLLHTSHLVAVHTELKEEFENLILSLKLDRKDESEILQSRLKALWESDFVPSSSSFKQSELPSFSLVWKNSEKFIERLEVIMENHASEERLTYDRPDPFWGIVIGGNTLSRGLTLEGLTTSYFLRGSKGYDTLLQMGRWFGYRPNYVDLTRIYVSEDLQTKFFHLATVEQEMREEIKTMAANRERPIDVGLRIRTHPSMTVTSNLKMRSAQTTGLTYSGSKIQALYMNLQDQGILKNNFKAVTSFLDSIEKYHGQAQTPGFEDLSKCLLYRNVSAELVLQFLEKYEFSTANIRFTAKMISDYVRDLNGLNELNSWSVALMSPKSGEAIKLGSNREIFKVDRSIVKRAKSERDPNSQHIKVLTTPRDEIVDLRDKIDTKFKMTDDVFENLKISEVYIRQNIRPKDRGLLLLYALNTNVGISEKDRTKFINSPSQTMPVLGAGDAIGVAFVFPKTNNSKSNYRYVVNGTV